MQKPMKLFGRIINLAHRTDRWQRMHSYLNLGIDIRRFNAVQVSQEQALEVVDGLEFKALLDPWPRTSDEQLKGLGSVGCYLSHVGVWQEFLESDASIALVLEDDIDPKQANLFKQSLEYMMNRRAEWDVGLLGWVGTLYDPHKGFIGAHAYLLSRNAASALVRDAFPLTKQVDFYLNDHVRNGLRLLTVPAEQRIRQLYSESNVYTTTYLHWAYLIMLVFSVAYLMTFVRPKANI
jgi:glycosyl transferase family 25